MPSITRFIVALIVRSWQFEEIKTFIYGNIFSSCIKFLQPFNHSFLSYYGRHVIQNVLTSAKNKKKRENTVCKTTAVRKLRLCMESFHLEEFFLNVEFWTKKKIKFSL